MRSPRLTAALAVLLLLLFASSSVFAATGDYLAWNQGFDTNAAGWLDSDDPGWTDYGNIVQVPSGTGGITAASGTGFAQVTGTPNESGPFSRFDGYRSVWPGTWTAEIAVYLDPAAWTVGDGFDYSVAANGTNGNHRRDFVFHVVKYSGPDRIVVAGSNNSNFAPRLDLESINNFDVSVAGWYKLQHRFYEQGGVLHVDLNLLNASDTVLFTETRTDPSDLIPSVVGGNRYAWFTFVKGVTLPVDNHSLSIFDPGISTLVVTPGDLEQSTNLVVAQSGNKWFFYNDENDTINNTLGTFVAGPAAPPEAPGSVQISVSGTQRRNLATYQFRGTPLADIDVLAFSTYNPSAGNGGSATRSGYLQFNVDFNGSDTWQRRLVYVPSANGTVQQNTWQEWDAIDAGAALWSWSGYANNGNKWPDNNTSVNRTWADILAAFPSARIRVTDSFLGIRVGEPYNDGYTENIDAFKFGANGSLTIFDFEPTTVVVTPGDLEPSTNLVTAASGDKWFFYNDENDTINNTLGTFVAGPAAPPEAPGSVQISVSGTQRRNLATYQFRGTPLADIDVLAFSTYNPSAGNGGSANRSGYLQFNVDFNGSDTWQRRLIFLPADNGAVVQNSWQEWDAINGGAALWRYSGSTWPIDSLPGTTPKSWSQILSQYSGVRIRVTDSFLGIRVGEPYNDGYTENIDAFKFGDNDGLTIFDFEPGKLYVEDAVINMHGQSTFNVPVKLEAGIHDLSSVGFTVAWNQVCLAFDSVTDSNNDDIPDSITGLPSDADFDVIVIRNGTDQEVTILIKPVLSSPPLPVLADGTLASLEFNAVACDALPGDDDVSASFTFPSQSQPVVPSFGNSAAESVDVATDSGIVTLNFNNAPTDITLDDNLVDENLPTGTTVGTLCTADDTPQGTDCSGGPGSFTYSLTTGGSCTSSAGNFAFTIDGNALKTNGALNFEAQASYDVCVQSTDAYGLSRVETFTVNVVNLNEAPVDIALSDSHVDENATAPATVGTLSTIDEDTANTHTYTQCPVPAPLSQFSISGTSLQTTVPLNFEQQSSYNICIRSTDNGVPALFVQRTFTISVDDVNDAPVAVNDPASPPLIVVGGTSVVIDVLANDTDQDAGDVLSVNSVANGAHGTTSIAPAPNTVTYAAAAAYNGPDSFTYTAKDNNTPVAGVSNVATVSLNVVANNVRADCNADGQIDAADFPATVLEIFDTDSGIGWWLTYTGAFPGSPRGCDSNASENGLTGTAPSVDAADIICTVLIFFGNESCATAVSAAATEATATLTLGELSGAAGATVAVPITLESAGNRVAAATFALSFDGAAASFDPTDSDSDGVPDAITLNVPASMAKTVIFDPATNRIQVAVYGTSLPMPVLSDGVLATVDLQVIGGASVLTLTQASLGSDAGQSIPVLVDGNTTPTQGDGTLFLPLLSQK